MGRTPLTGLMSPFNDTSPINADFEMSSVIFPVTHKSATNMARS